MRLLVAGIAIVVAVVFMSQNNDEVELNFLMFSVSARLWVGLLATLVSVGARPGGQVLWSAATSSRRGRLNATSERGPRRPPGWFDQAPRNRATAASALP